MDFYDDFYGSRKKKKSQGFNIVNSLISAVIGGLIVLLLLPTLIQAGLIDLSPAEHSLPAVQTTDQNQVNVPSNSTTQVNLDINSGIVQAVDKVKPAVIGVVNIQEQSNFWTRTTTNVDAGVGSGFVFDKRNGKAYIITNYHVIEGAKNVEVALADGERIAAELLGADQLTDLAVLSIDERYVEAIAELGDSSNLNPGEPAIAIGNPLGLEFSQSVTVGVISSAHRTISNSQTDWETEVIQTDAAINPGNSGGPLVNIEGQVIGINSAKIAESGVEGLGFAIPISDAKPIIDQLIQYGKVKRAYMGVKLYDLHMISQQDRKEVLHLPDNVTEGVVIYELEKFSSSGLAGLERFDVIVKLDDQPIGTSSDLRKYLYKNKKVGDQLKVTIYRNGKLQTIEMKLSEYPAQ